MQKNETRKAINFDLDTKDLKRYYCKTNNPFERLKAYREIGDFLKKNGFSHRQWSGYTSNNPLSMTEITDIVSRLSEEKSWFPKCVRKFDVTEIGEQYDMMNVIYKVAKTADLAKSATKAKSESKSHSDSSSQKSKEEKSSELPKTKTEKKKTIKKSKGFDYGD